MKSGAGVRCVLNRSRDGTNEEFGNEIHGDGSGHGKTDLVPRRQPREKGEEKKKGNENKTI